MDYRPQTAQESESDARARRLRVRDEERARRLQGGESIYGQARPAASPPSVNPSDDRPKTGAQQYADQIFLELLNKDRRVEEGSGSVGDKALADMLPPSRYDIPTPPKPIDTPIPSRPQTASKLSKEQYKAELLAQIEEDRRRKSLAKAYQRESDPSRGEMFVPRPHIRKQDPNRPSDDNPVAEFFQVKQQGDRKEWMSDETSIRAEVKAEGSESLLDIDWPGGYGCVDSSGSEQQCFAPQMDARAMNEYELEKAKLILEKQQAKEELLRIKEAMLNEKEKRLQQMMQLLQLQTPQYPGYQPVPPPCAPVSTPLYASEMPQMPQWSPYVVATPQPQGSFIMANPPTSTPPPRTPMVPFVSDPVPVVSRKFPDFAHVECSLRNSSKLISPEVYSNPSANLFKGDESPYESLMKEPSLVQPVPITERPLPLQTSINAQFADFSAEDTLTYKDRDSVASSAQQVELSEPKYGCRNSESIVSSHESLINEYESNFETALMENFSLTNQWKAGSSGDIPAKEKEIDDEESYEAAPYDPELQDSCDPGLPPPALPHTAQPTSYTQKTLLEYRKQAKYGYGDIGNIGRILKVDRLRNDAITLSFLQQTSVVASTPGNPFARSESKLPTQENDPVKGAEAKVGRTAFLLVTTFDRNVPGSGKVWVVPYKAKERHNSFVLVAGLQTPTGVCFDKNHDFMYVCDSAQGKVLQFEITHSPDTEFILASDQVATILESQMPSACSVDAFGNLYVTDLAANSIAVISYESLWAGYVGMDTELYTGWSSDAGIDRPVAIEVESSDTLYFVNNLRPEDAGVIVAAPAQASRGIADLTALLRSEQKPWGLALGAKLAYFSVDDGTVWAFSYKSRANLYLKSAGFFTAPRGLCYGDGRVYVADFGRGEVYWFPDAKAEEVTPQGFVRVAGAYSLACVNL